MRDLLSPSSPPRLVHEEVLGDSVTVSVDANDDDSSSNNKALICAYSRATGFGHKITGKGNCSVLVFQLKVNALYHRYVYRRFRTLSQH